jgi:Mor family transcriptional regulator
MKNDAIQYDTATALLYDMTEVIREAFALDEIAALVMAEIFLSGCRSKWGAQEIYFPAPDKRERDAAIKREFNGRNLREVCQKHRVSRSRLYEIVST